MMPTLQRARQSPTDLRKASQKPSEVSMSSYPMIKSDSQSSEDDSMDLQTPKPLQIPSTTRMPVQYESDEESVSPCPDDYEDAKDSFSDVEFDPSLDLSDDEYPSIVEAARMPIKSVRPLLVNISTLAPINKRSTAAHVRPGMSSHPSWSAAAVGRTVAAPAVVTLAKPPYRKPVAQQQAPAIPARSEARTPVGAIPVETATRPFFPPRKDSHASRPSVSTVASSFDDDRSSIADSTDSSAPSSVADESDIKARNSNMLAEPVRDVRKDSILRAQDADLERAIEDYMMWRSEASPTGTHNTVSVPADRPSPTNAFYNPPSARRFAVDGGNGGDKRGMMGLREEEDEEWRREIEKGLATPTPTSYAAYDPFNMEQPRLRRMDAGRARKGSGSSDGSAGRQGGSGPMNGLKKGLGMVRRNLQ